MLSKNDIAALCAPFDDKTLGVKVQSVSKNKDKAMLVCYLQHTDVAARLDSVDPAWDAVITDERAAGGPDGGSIVRMRITLKGVAREGVGDGQDAKSAASDALKRTAMLFGVGRYLYDSETVWVAYNEQTDRYRQFTVAEYNAALRPGQSKQGAVGNAPAGVVSGPRANVAAPAALSRIQLGAAIDKVSRSIGLSASDADQWVYDLYKKAPAQLTTSELQKFYDILLNELAQKAET